MPCPYFEPLWPTSSMELANARLPLIQEYAGRCRQLHPEAPKVGGLACNQGYALGTCPHFPETEKNRAYRYSLLSRSPNQLELLFVCEEEYFPTVTQRLHYLVEQNRFLEADLEANVFAQAAAFCQSYLARHCPYPITLTAQP